MVRAMFGLFCPLFRAFGTNKQEHHDQRSIMSPALAQHGGANEATFRGLVQTPENVGGYAMFPHLTFQRPASLGPRGVQRVVLLPGPCRGASAALCGGCLCYQVIFLNPRDALVPKIRFFVFCRISGPGHLRGPGSVGVWGAHQLSPFGRGGGV